MKNDKKNKIVGIQTFREVVRNSESNNSGVFEQPDLFQIDDFLKDIADKIFRFLEPVTRGSSIFSFVIHFSQYIYIRLRVIVVLSNVFIEVLTSLTNNFKQSVIQSIFWGRGNLFRHAVQMFIGLMIFVFVLFSSYRRGVVTDTEAMSLEVYGDDFEEKEFQTDLLVQSASTITQKPEDRARVGIMEYEVKPDDSIFKIAQFFEITEQTLRDANDLSAANIIRPGDVLKVPPGDGVIIKVKSGENLEEVAKKYKGKEQTIAEVNWLDPPFKLDKGQELFIPGGVMPVEKKVRTTYSGVIRTNRPNVQYSSYVDSNVGRFLGWPVSGGKGGVSQCYHSYHNGIDIADGSMPDLVAAADGTVKFAGCHSGSCPPPGQLVGGSKGGWGVEVDHGNGYTTVYVHMYSIYVKSGQKVKKGQSLGKMGMSGTATGIHVHFMLWKGGRWNNVNPAKYMARHVCGY